MCAMMQKLRIWLGSVLAGSSRVNARGDKGYLLGLKNFGNARAEGGARVSLFSHSQTLSGGLSLAIKLLTKLAQGVSKSYAY